MTKALKRRNRRFVVAMIASALAVLIGVAHSEIADDHMGEAAAACLAVIAGGSAALAAAPRLGRLLPGPSRARDWRRPPREPLALIGLDGRARGDPSVLQVFRR